jgi:hypothetical protein
MSVGPPGGNPTTNLIGLSGYAAQAFAAKSATLLMTAGRSTLAKIPSTSCFKKRILSPIH